MQTFKFDNNEMKTWGQMTDEEKGGLLLAHHEGKVIEWFDIYTSTWEDKESTVFYHPIIYRVKPEPKVETVEVFSSLGPVGLLVKAIAWE